MKLLAGAEKKLHKRKEFSAFCGLTELSSHDNLRMALFKSTAGLQG